MLQEKKQSNSPKSNKEMNKEVIGEISNCSPNNVSQLDALNTLQQGGESENLDQNTTQTEQITDFKPTTEEEKLCSTEFLAFTEELRRNFIEAFI